MNKMTNQSIFDTVVEHFKKQKVRAYGTLIGNEEDGSQCLYRGPNKTSCAFGCLIPDKKYNIKMEGRSAPAVINQYLPEFNLFKPIIKELQIIHDSECNAKTLLTPYSSARLRNLAVQFKLDASKVDW